jgi:hypothetical protein
MSISSVTSEALQLKLRQLLPSQQGFGTDLSASDTIIPVIDLTASAEGSDVRQDLQTAIAYGSQTAFRARNSTVTIVNVTGFHRIYGNITSFSAGTSVAGTVNITDGATPKQLFEFSLNGPTDVGFSNIFDFVVFLVAGESVTATSNNNNCYIAGSARQIADINGTLVQPVGFTPQ